MVIPARFSGTPPSAPICFPAIVFVGTRNRDNLSIIPGCALTASVRENKLGPRTLGAYTDLLYSFRIGPWSIPLELLLDIVIYRNWIFNFEYCNLSLSDFLMEGRKPSYMFHTSDIIQWNCIPYTQFFSIINSIPWITHHSIFVHRHTTCHICVFT